MSARVLAAVKHWDSELLIPYRYTFLRCVRCGGVMVASQEIDCPADLEPWDLEPWHELDAALAELGVVEEDEEPFRVYPPVKRRGGVGVPYALIRSLNEAERCFQARSYTASAIMCRKALDGLCAHFDIPEENLARALKELHNSGVIDSNLYSWADALRATGNEAAHGVDFSATRDDALDVLDFTEAILDYVFVYRQRFEEFVKRRAPDG